MVSSRGLYSQSKAMVSRQKDSPWWTGPRSVMCIWGAAVLCHEGWGTPGCTSCMLLTWCDWQPLLEWLLPENRQKAQKRCLLNRAIDMEMENIPDVYKSFIMSYINCEFHNDFDVLFIWLSFHKDLKSKNRIWFIFVKEFISMNQFWFISAIN